MTGPVACRTRHLAATQRGTDPPEGRRSQALAAVVITYNAERGIVRCLESLSFCEEVVVVDSGSEDRTRELAGRFTRKVFLQPWQGYAQQKNYANGLTDCDWVLSLDADEEVSDQLRSEIIEVFRAPIAPAAFSMPRKAFHLGRWILHGTWYPNRQVRLFRKSAGHWIGPEVHERWTTQGEIGRLEGHILHYSYTGVADQWARAHLYASLTAARLHREGQRFSFSQLLVAPLQRFVWGYVLKRGFLDGYPGLVISACEAYTVFLGWYQLRRSIGGTGCAPHASGSPPQ